MQPGPHARLPRRHGGGGYADAGRLRPPRRIHLPVRTPGRRGTAGSRRTANGETIFAGNDEIALGVIETARTRGRPIPEDLSIVGFDDTLLARMASPSLTALRLA